MRAAFLVLAGLAGALSVAAAPPIGERPPNLLLITVDTLRPDALGWVAGRNDTPAIDALAKEGFRFAAAVSPVPLTLPAHASMMTGLLPRRHGVRDNGQILAQAIPTLAERLRDDGYRTAAFVSGFPLRADFGLDRGFDHYDDTLPDGLEGWVERPAPETTRAALDWLRSLDSSAGPWFLWVHYYDPHDPYDPPRAFWRPGPRGRYDGEVVLVDDAIGQLRDGLRLKGLDGGSAPPLLTIFTADHGESLGEHRESTHGYFIYDSTVLVPLIFHFPERVVAGESPASPRLMDIAATAADLLGLSPFANIDGITLLGLIEGGEQTLPPAYVETRQPWISYGWAPLRAVRHDGFKLIAAPRPELYDLEGDPGETQNLVHEDRRRARDLQSHLRRIESLPEARSVVREDPEVTRRLRALGYLGSGGGSGREPPPGLPDPKDRLDLRDQLAAGEDLLRRGQLAAAVERFEVVLTAEPDNRFAQLRAGIAWLKAGRLEQAQARLEKAVKLDPDQAESRYALADTLTRLGRFEPAIEQWLETLRLQPRRVAAWSNMGSAMLGAGRKDDAIEAFRRAVELAPEDPKPLWNLALAERNAGKPKVAREHLATAEELARASAAPFPFAATLGLLIAETGGDPAQARAHLEASRPDEAAYAQGRLALARLELAAGQREAALARLREALTANEALRKEIAQDDPLAELLASLAHAAQ